MYIQCMYCICTCILIYTEHYINIYTYTYVRAHMYIYSRHQVLFICPKYYTLFCLFIHMFVFVSLDLCMCGCISFFLFFFCFFYYFHPNYYFPIASFYFLFSMHIGIENIWNKTNQFSCCDIHVQYFEQEKEICFVHWQATEPMPL